MVGGLSQEQDSKPQEVNQVYVIIALNMLLIADAGCGPGKTPMVREISTSL